MAREELLQPRRTDFAKLDVNGNRTLAFEEWAATTTKKFAGRCGPIGLADAE